MMSRPDQWAGQAIVQKGGIPEGKLNKTNCFRIIAGQSKIYDSIS